MGIKSLIAFVLFCACVADAAPSGWIAYVGTYTRQGSKGIYAYRFDPATGGFTAIGLAAETSNPTFLAVDPKGRFLYAANEDNAGKVSAFAIDSASGQLKLLNQVSSQGAGPCHVAVDKTGHWLLAANYNSGSIASFPIHADGSLGEAASTVQHTGKSVNPSRQSGPHAHEASLSPDNRFALFNDLGLDQILVYRLDAAKGTLTPNDPPFGTLPPGSGPRHLAFSKDGKFVYCINEMLNTITTFRYDAKRGSLEAMGTVPTLGADFKGTSTTAEIAIHPKGKFLYGSNRGENTIALFTIDPKTGALTAVDRFPTQGRTPRNFAIDPTGAYLFAANQDSANILEYKIDAATGRLTPGTNITDIAQPVCIVFTK
jgi:6-phosphogluconolactonase